MLFLIILRYQIVQVPLISVCIPNAFICMKREVGAPLSV